MIIKLEFPEELDIVEISEKVRDLVLEKFPDLEIEFDGGYEFEDERVNESGALIEFKAR